MNDLMTNWALTYLLHSTVIVAALWAIDRRSWLRDPALRERLWRAAFVVPVLSAALQVAAPQMVWSQPVVVVEYRDTGSVAATSKNRDAESVAPTAASVAPTAPTPTAKSVAPTSEPLEWFSILVGAWLLAAVVLLLQTAASVVAGRRWLRDRRVVADGVARSVLDELSAAAGVTARLSVADVPGPMALPRGEICVPPRALELERDELRGMLAHELAHVVRRDAEQRLVVTIGCALLALQPLNFLVRRRLEEVAELNADDYARELLGDGRPLARCLLTVATWLEPVRAPAFAAAMTESDAGLLARVRRLASSAPVPRGWRGRGALFALLLVAAFAAPGIVLTAIDPDGGRASSVHVQRDGDRMSVTASGEDLDLKLRATGEVRFALDDTGIEYLEPGETLTLRTRDRRGDGLWHDLAVTAGRDGKLNYRYEVDDEPRAFDAAARAWLSGILPEVFRATGMQAEARVERIHVAGGPDAVLAELAQIRSDFVSRVYFEELGNYQLTTAQRARAYRLAGESIGSDYDLRNALVAMRLPESATMDEALALLEAAREIGSDYDLAELLVAVTDRLPADPRIGAAFASTAQGIGSDYDLARTLIAASSSRWARERDALAAIVRVSSEIGSDHDLQRTLKHIAELDGADNATARMVLEVAGDEIGSDHDLLQVLLAIAPLAKEDAALRAMYEETARELDDHQYGRAMRAL